MENINNTQFDEQMLPPLDAADAKALADAIADVLDSKKGHDIKVMHVEDKTVIAEYFVVCTGNSSTQIKALAGEVEYQMDLREVKVDNFEGRDNGAWIVLDYSSVMVHVMSRESREFYDLEKLFDGAQELDLRPAEDESENN